MKKFEQMKINLDVLAIFGDAKNEYLRSTDYSIKPLRRCTAEVIETEHYYMLRSYNALIACISKGNDTLYDALRYVYGYTATSAQHIAKFRHDYGAGKRGCADTETFRWIKE